MTTIYFKDNCAWFEEGHTPSKEDQILLKAVTESLGGHLPKRVEVHENPDAWYVLVSDGVVGVFPELTSFAEYSMSTDVSSPLPD